MRTSYTPDALSPFDGFNDVVRNFFRGEIPLDFYLKFNEQEDYNAYKKKTTAGTYEAAVQSRPDRSSVTNNEIITRLEDTDVSWLLNYFKNLLENLNGKQSKSCLDTYRNTYMKERIFMADSEDGEMSDPEMNVVHTNQYSAEELYSWQNKVPYLLQRLHARSKKSGVHLVSVMIAFMKASQGITGRIPKPGEMEKVGFYRMSKEGYMGDALTNKHGGAAALKWVRGILDEDTDKYFLDDSSYQEMQELLDICDRVGIDLTKTHPHSFQEDTMKKLLKTYIPSNKEVCGRINRSVVDGLKSLKLDKYNKPIPKQDEMSLESIAASKALAFLCSTEKNIVYTRDTNRHDYIPGLTIALFHFNGSSVRITKDTATVDGFYVDKNGDYIIVPVRQIKAPHDYSYKAIVHYSGALILLDSQEINLTYLLFNNFADYIQELTRLKGKFKDVNPGARFSNNVAFGRWEETVK